ncbi:unnamed protein product, partial [Prorocentrum cordatum]
FAGSRFCRQASPRTASWAPVGLTTSLGKAEGGGQEAIRRRRRRTRTARRPYHQSPACESTSRVGRSLAVNSRPALAQRQQSRRPQTGGRADPDTHTHTHTHTQHNKKTPGLVKRARASGPSVGGGPTRRSSKREQKQELSEVHANLIS